MKDAAKLSDEDIAQIADNRVKEALRLLLVSGYDISHNNYMAVLTGNATWRWQNRAQLDTRKRA